MKKKYQWELCQIIEWLGLVWNAVNGTIRLTDRRMSSMSDALHVILKNDQIVSARQLDSLWGRLYRRQLNRNNDSVLLNLYCSSLGLGFQFLFRSILHGRTILLERSFGKDKLQAN